MNLTKMLFPLPANSNVFVFAKCINYLLTLIKEVEDSPSKVLSLHSETTVREKDSQHVHENRKLKPTA